MKIGVLIDELIHGGFQKVALMEVANFRKLGHKADLVVLHRINDEGYTDLLKQYSIQPVYLSDRLPLWLKINFKFPLFAFFSFFHIFYYFFIDKYISKKEYDIYLVHGTYTAFSAIKISRRKGIPYIAYIHDPISYILKQKYTHSLISKLNFILLPLARKIDKNIIHNSIKVIAYSDMIKFMSKLYPNKKKYSEIYNGVELKSFNSARKSFAITATKWDQGKNLEFLINIWDNISEKTPLKIVGKFVPEKLRMDYSRMIKDKKLETKVEIIGPVSENQLAKLYSEAIMLVHPCREAFGMTILEAWATGCPCVFSTNSGVINITEDQLTNPLPRENNIKDYYSSINYILELNKKEYQNLSRMCYSIASKNSWQNHCKKIIQLIEECH